MKWTIINFLLIIIFINHLCRCSINSHFVKPSKSGDNPIMPAKLIQCKICHEMFDLNFNYDDFLKSGKILSIKKAFETLNDKKVTDFFSKDNMDFITKEISMQYFFKGADNLIDEADSLKLKDCQIKKLDQETCEMTKMTLCERILNYEKKSCTNIKSHMKNLMSINKYQSEVVEIDKSVKKSDYIPEHPENIINFKKFHFKQKEKEDMKDEDDIKKFGKLSLLQLSPEYIKDNFDSTPKSHWQPPKPVLLQNFERNIGDQLKDISGLAT
jgi:hypothetical protein